jgi:hypothetical protein
MTGSERAAQLQRDKIEVNAKVYAGLDEPALSRQAKRRAARKAVKHTIAVAKAEAIRHRRKGILPSFVRIKDV